MSRLLSAIKMDVTVQVRSHLYTIGIVAGLLVAVAVAQLGNPDQLFSYIPALMLLVAGGSTLLYVAGMITFERDEGTLSAVIVSPLRSSEYLWAKVITLTALATLEAMIMIGGAMLIMRFSGAVPIPNVPLLLLGIVAIGVMYTLVGIVMIVRYASITDFLVPMSGLAVILQLPFIYFLGWITNPVLLVIPTSAPTMLMRAAYVPLAPWEWIYGVGYTTVVLLGLIIWAYRAFNRHIIRKAG